MASPEYPGERLLACRNPQLAKLRAIKREELLAATERRLQAIKDRVAARRLAGADAIGVCVGKVITSTRWPGTSIWSSRTTASPSRASTRRSPPKRRSMGIYIIRTSMDARRMEAADCVRNYKALANVERAFRSLKTVDLKVGRFIPARPIAFARTSCCACSPTMWSGTCARLGAR